MFCSVASSEVIWVFANGSSRERKSILTSSGVVAIPLVFFAGGFKGIFGLTLGSAEAELTTVEKTGAAFEKVIEGTEKKVVTEVVQGITICLVLMRLLVVVQVVATWQLVTGRLTEETTGATEVEVISRPDRVTAERGKGSALSMTTVSSKLKNEISSAGLLWEQAELEMCSGMHFLCIMPEHLPAGHAIGLLLPMIFVEHTTQSGRGLAGTATDVFLLLLALLVAEETVVPLPSEVRASWKLEISS